MGLDLTKPDEIKQHTQDITLVNNTLLNTDFTVPGDELWQVTAISVKNGDDVTRTITIWILNSSSAGIFKIAERACTAANWNAWPNIIGGTTYLKELNKDDFFIVGGHKLRISLAAGGASAGGTGKITINYKKWFVGAR